RRRPGGGGWGGASRWRMPAANSDVPRKTTLKVASGRGRALHGARGLLRFAHRAHRLLARLARDPIEYQHAVEVVDLVLYHAGGKAVGLDQQLPAGGTARA